jgi:hypothetical protein
VNVDRSEAFDMFKKWGAERSLIRCRAVVRWFRVSFSARVVKLSASRVIFASDDQQTQLILPLNDDVRYEYGDSRHFPEDDEKYDSVMVAYFTEPPPVGYPDMIAFSEFRDPNAKHF